MDSPGWDLSDIFQKLSETIGSLDIRLINLTDLCEYPGCCFKLFKILVFIQVAKHFEVHQWAQQQEYVVLHMPYCWTEVDSTRYLEQKHTQETSKSRGEMAGFTQSLNAVQVEWQFLPSPWIQCTGTPPVKEDSMTCGQVHVGPNIYLA